MHISCFHGERWGWYFPFWVEGLTYSQQSIWKPEWEVRIYRRQKFDCQTNSESLQGIKEKCTAWNVCALSLTSTVVFDKNSK